MCRRSACGFVAGLLISTSSQAVALQQRLPDQPVVTREQVTAPPPPIAFDPWKEVDEPEGAIEYDESFPSAFESPYPANNVVPLRIFVPDSANGPVPVVLVTHYWGATDLRAERSLAADLNSRGLAAAILTLPYHLSRTPPGHHSGDLAIQPDVAKLTDTMLQSELDIRRALDFLDTRKEFVHGRYGVIGTSLGALVSGLAYALDSRIAYATFILGGADIAHILWTSSRVVPAREELRRIGWTESRLRRVLAPVEPLTYLPRAGAGQTFIIYGKYDTVVPYQSTRELLDALKSPETLELNTGHYGGIFAEHRILTTVADFFDKAMAGKSYNPPKRLVSPTVRIGGILGYPEGGDLGIGLDLLHFDRKGERFGAIFATPRGLKAYLGQSLGQGFSIGLIGSSVGFGVGLIWSVVL